MSNVDPNTPFVTILIITYRRIDLLKQCLFSLRQSLKFANQHTPLNHETLVVLNGEDPITRDYLKQQPNMFLLQTNRITPPAARNLAIQSAKGQYICFLDDDVLLPIEYFKHFYSHLITNPQIEILGGPDSTPPHSNHIQKIIGHALRSPLATFKTRQRHGQPFSSFDVPIPANERQLILCNLWVKRSLFSDENITFDARFCRNEENVLLFQLQKKQIFYLAAGFIYHERKTKFLAFSKSVFFSGYFRAKSFCLYPRSFKIEFLFPTFFCIFILLYPILYSIDFFYKLILSSYLLLNLFFSIQLIFVKSIVGETLAPHLIPGVMLYQFLLNVLYGLGFGYGLIRSFLYWERRSPTSQQPPH